MMKTRIQTLLRCAVLLAAAIVIASCGNSSGNKGKGKYVFVYQTSNRVPYEFTDEDFGTPIVAQEYKGNIGKVYFDQPPRRIRERLFKEDVHLTSVTLPEGLKEIGSFAFAGTALLEIDIPATVTTIGDGAFQHCKILKSVNVPPSVRSIGKGIFAGCDMDILDVTVGKASGSQPIQVKVD